MPVSDIFQIAINPAGIATRCEHAGTFAQPGEPCIGRPDQNNRQHINLVHLKFIKAPVFAWVIALVGTMRGMQVRGSSRELGRLTTVAVVQSIFLVILFDAIFAVIFMELDI